MNTNELRTVRLIWDEWNINHIAKHEVTRVEIEEIFAGRPTARETYKNRLLVVGPTTSGRILTVVIGHVPGSTDFYYTFSARPASRTERRYYRERVGET